ncbi:hypothetical protein C4D60_Mb03t15840 [Musa balbisiana]|uniref:Uncharacterized protein n=1 Tax=Musa balbisiana TaxID=52838 RepID=A0A4S8JA54_MUSBA|nr:hypothetical protein C4D60_Mb03t15840 [Musa balbisiana]
MERSRTGVSFTATSSSKRSFDESPVTTLSSGLGRSIDTFLSSGLGRSIDTFCLTICRRLRFASCLFSLYFDPKYYLISDI